MYAYNGIIQRQLYNAGGETIILNSATIKLKANTIIQRADKAHKLAFPTSLYGAQYRRENWVKRAAMIHLLAECSLDNPDSLFHCH